MAIADTLQELATDISAAYGKIDDKGGALPANKNTNNLANAIDSIPSGIDLQTIFGRKVACGTFTITSNTNITVTHEDVGTPVMILAINIAPVMTLNLQRIGIIYINKDFANIATEIRGNRYLTYANGELNMTSRERISNVTNTSFTSAAEVNYQWTAGTYFYMVIGDLLQNSSNEEEEI